MKLVMFAHNTEDVIESDEYGKAVFDAEVTWADQQSLMGVHAHYRIIFHLGQYLCTAKQLV